MTCTKGSTPPENMLQNLPADAPRADVLLLGCGDARHALYSLWAHLSGLRGSGRWDGVGARALSFTLNDKEPAVLARVLLLLHMF
ncbi:unnamed protein product, partial [Choristocarpus tenellus]